MQLNASARLAASLSYSDIVSDIGDKLKQRPTKFSEKDAEFKIPGVGSLYVNYKGVNPDKDVSYFDAALTVSAVDGASVKSSQTYRTSAASVKDMFEDLFKQVAATTKKLNAGLVKAQGIVDRDGPLVEAQQNALNLIK